MLITMSAFCLCKRQMLGSQARKETPRAEQQTETPTLFFYLVCILLGRKAGSVNRNLQASGYQAHIITQHLGVLGNMDIMMFVQERKAPLSGMEELIC